MFFWTHNIQVWQPQRETVTWKKNRLLCQLTLQRSLLFAPRDWSHRIFARKQQQFSVEPQSNKMLPSVSFLIPAAAEEDWKLSSFLEFPEYMWLSFLQFCHPRLQSTLIPVKHHREAEICQKFTISCRDEVFRQFFCEQILKIEFHFQTFESNVSFSTRCNSELGLEFAIKWERNSIFGKIPLNAKNCFFKIREFFEFKFLLRKHTFRKINTCTCRFRFRQRCQKVFAQTPWVFSQNSRNFQLLVQLRL